MSRWILVGILALGLAGTGFWGYQEHQEKKAVMIQAENNYQRAFHNLTYQVDALHDKIGSSLAMNRSEQLSAQLAKIWRSASKAASSADQLPLTLLPFEQTKAFLSDIGDFTYEIAVRNLDEKPLSDKEFKTLHQLHQESKDIKDELRQVQHTVLDNQLQWREVQERLADKSEHPNNSIIDGFESVEQKIKGYTENSSDSYLAKTSSEERNYKNLDDVAITKQKAMEQGAALFGTNNPDDLRVQESGNGADIPLYSITYQNEKERGHLDITKQGGHPLTLIMNRQIGSQQISLNKGLKKAQNYLDHYNFDNMEVVSSKQYDNVGFYSFVYSQNGVNIYPDAIEMKIALDNGDLLGMTANHYFANHKERDIAEPELNVDEAKEKISQDVKIKEDNMAVMINSKGEEVLVYEFSGVFDGETYQININAKNGEEEEVKKMNGTEVNYAS